jgi:methionyl-tRNA synthetase
MAGMMWQPLQTICPPGMAFTVPDVLFAKITDEQRADWEARFSGQR